MKENKTSGIQILSNRARDFLNSPRHQKAFSDLYKDCSWDFLLDNGGNSDQDFQNDKILTLTYFISPTENDLEKLLYESLSRMSSERTVSFLIKLSFRELENFLRDENHLPVFLETEQVLALERFKVVKNSLLAGVFYKKIEKFIGPLKGWSEYSLVEKNLQAKRLLSLLNNLISRVKMPELTLAESEDIFIVMNDCPLDCEVIEKLFQRCFRVSSEKTSFKVVAVQ